MTAPHDVHTPALERSRKRAALAAWDEAVRSLRRLGSSVWIHDQIVLRERDRDWQTAARAAGLYAVMTPRQIAEGR